MFLKFVANVCRVCLEPKGEVNIFESGHDEEFRFITLLDISEKEELPSHLCNKCVGRLKIAYEFKNQAISSNTHLHSFINSINTKFSTIVESHKKELHTSIEEIQAFLSPEEVSTLLKPIKTNTQDEVSDSSEVKYINDPVEEEHIDNEDYVGNEEYEITIEEVKPSESIKASVSREDFSFCAECNKPFSTKPNLMRHMLTHSKAKPYQCSICGNRFTQNGSLKQHMLSHTGERPFKCEICKKTFTRKTMLRIHMRTHTGEKPYPCVECNISFTVKGGLRKHIAIHHEGTAKDQFPCTICDKVLRSKHSMNMHMNLHKGNDECKHECLICMKSFTNKYNLKYHMKTHEVKESFKCSICDKLFNSKGNLRYHLNTHNKVKEDYKCSVCNEQFPKKYQLLAHLQSHEKRRELNYECRKCHKKFTVIHNLIEHLRDHVDNNGTVFRCTYCTVAFNVKRNLKLHLANFHKDEVPDLNDCDICDIPFVTGAHLNEHITKKHDIVDEVCSDCNETFTSKKLYLEHCISHDIIELNKRSK